MEGLIRLSTLVIVCMLVTAPLASEAAVYCDSVNNDLSQCFSYLTGGTLFSGCCPGVRRVNNMARTAIDRQEFCVCLQQTAKTLGSQLISSRATSLLGFCSVKIPYPISALNLIDCKKIK